MLWVLVLAALGCGPQGQHSSQPDPCRDDLFGCLEPPAQFELDPECFIDGDLDVEIGWGQEVFHDFGEVPEVQYGFQGGQHIFWGIRVSNAALDRYDLLRVTYRTYATMSPEECASAIADSREFNPDDLPAELRDDPALGPEPEPPIFVYFGAEDDRLPISGQTRCLLQGSGRVMVLGATQPIDVSTGRVEEVGFLVELPFSTGDYVGSVEVEDPCGRVGFDVAAFPN